MASRYHWLMKLPVSNRSGFRVRVGGNFWGVAGTALFLFVLRWLFDEPFFLNSLYVLIIYLVLAFIYVLFALDFCTVERIAPHRRWKVGDRFAETFHVKNQFIIPVFWMELQDHAEIQKKKFGHVTGLLGFKKQKEIKNNCMLERRGNIPLGPVDIISSDPLACFFVTRTLKPQESIKVQPYRIELSAGKGHKKDTDSGKTSRLAMLQHDITSSSVRPYMEGDPLKQIHWPTTARRGKIHTRLQDMRVEQTAWMVLDCQAAVYTKAGVTSNDADYSIGKSTMALTAQGLFNQDTFEMAVSITATLVETWIKRGIAIGLAMNQQPEQILNPGYGRHQLESILDTLTYIRAVSKYPASVLMRNLSKRILPGQICYLITPDSSVTLYQSCLEAAKRGIDVRVVHIDKSGFTGNPDKDIPVTNWPSIRRMDFHKDDSLSVLSNFL